MQLWRLVQGGGWRAERDHHCIAGHHEWPIVRWFAVSASLCHSLSLTERNEGKELNRDKEIDLERTLQLIRTRDKNQNTPRSLLRRSQQLHPAGSESDVETQNVTVMMKMGMMVTQTMVAFILRGCDGFCPSVICANTLFSHAYILVVSHT